MSLNSTAKVLAAGPAVKKAGMLLSGFINMNKGGFFFVFFNFFKFFSSSFFFLVFFLVFFLGSNRKV